ncbi:MAG: alanine--tRNA ligase, partial [Gammaproteobacteria bacterium]|nr:alanine--tRNA ligase [Gammaproteobacteria bacterium]
WSMGDTGPCGPCSEIFYDQGDHLEGGLPGTKDQDGDRYVEIWNLVFMEKNQIRPGEMVDLSKKSIDTGMGLERIASIMQGVYDNFETDIFKVIINNISDITETKSIGDNKFSHRIIADHLRSSAFLIADGVMPLNEGRGYVLRRIMRRAIRHIHRLKYNDLLLHKILPILVAEMGQCFPELVKHQELIAEIFKQEESSFRVTIDRGMKLIHSKTKDLEPNSVLSGKIAFELHDTYGFPVDLTEDILKENKISINMEEFNQCMNEQKEKARKAWVGSGEKEVQNIWFDIKDSYGLTEFLGYTNDVSQGRITGLIQDGKKAESISNDKEFYLVTNQTPFYGESGGQVGDIGEIYDDNNLKISVLDTKKPLPGLHAHLCKINQGSVSIGDVVHLKIDVEHRDALRRSHTATHLLHSALKSLIGKHVSQRGSLVAEDRLRFDFSNNGSISRDKLDRIESELNALILSDAEVKTQLMKYDDAVKEGAIALFGEKYDSEVRVVSVQGKSQSHSIELCGGTHVFRLGEIGGVKIISESAISSGIRRIEAVTGREAYKSWRNDYNSLTDLALLLQAKNDEVSGKLSDLLKKNKSLEKELQAHKQSSLINTIGDKDVQVINEIHFLSKTIQDIEMGDLRNLLQRYLSEKENTVGLLFGHSQEKVAFVCGVTKDLHSKIGAKKLIKIVADHFNSNGGGNDFICQGGGKMESDKIESSIEEIKKAIKSI